MQAINPRTPAYVVERVLADAGEADARAWLTAHWSADFLAAGDAVVRLLVPYLEIDQVADRATTVLHAVDRDWVDVLAGADTPACGFLPAFWRNAFERAREHQSAKCIAWLLDNKAECLGGASRGLEL